MKDTADLLRGLKSERDRERRIKWLLIAVVAIIGSYLLFLMIFETHEMLKGWCRHE